MSPWLLQYQGNNEIFWSRQSCQDLIHAVTNDNISSSILLVHGRILVYLDKTIIRFANRENY